MISTSNKKYIIAILWQIHKITSLNIYAKIYKNDCQLGDGGENAQLRLFRKCIPVLSADFNGPPLPPPPPSSASSQWLCVMGRIVAT